MDQVVNAEGYPVTLQGNDVQFLEMLPPQQQFSHNPHKYCVDGVAFSTCPEEQRNQDLPSLSVLVEFRPSLELENQSQEPQEAAEKLREEVAACCAPCGFVEREEGKLKTCANAKEPQGKERHNEVVKSTRQVHCLNRVDGIDHAEQ